MAAIYTHAALVCSKGCVRKNNEDNYYFQGEFMLLKEMDAGAHIVQEFTQDKQLFGVMDGMGGEACGERASYLAAGLMHKSAEQILNESPAEALSQYALNATSLIYHDAVQKGVRSQGSTLAALALANGFAYVANVGDSRVYLLREGKLSRLSMDHSGVNQMVRAGTLTREQARKHPQNNIITQYLGMNPQQLPKQYVYTNSVKIARNDRYMLCSDGLCDLMSDEMIGEMLKNAKTPDKAAVNLVMQALEYGGKDNVTCIVVDAVSGKYPGKAPEIIEQDDETTQQ